MLAYILLLTGGFGALYFGAEWLVRGAARIAADMGVSPVVVGLTLVSLGTSAPELVVCIFFALDGQGSLLTANVLGSNLANVGLILGATAMIRPLAVADRVVAREVPIMIVITVFAYPLLLDEALNRGEGLILLALLVVYVAFTFSSAEEEVQEILEEVGDLADPEPGRLRNIGLVVVGAAGLGAGGKAVESGAVFLATELGISEMVIGVTVVAVGTSLPELVTSIVAAARHQSDIAVGNIIGSNIFNLTAVMGGAALVREYEIGPEILNLQLPMVLVLSVLVLPVVATARKVRRGEGFLLLATYVGFVTWITL